MVLEEKKEMQANIYKRNAVSEEIGSLRRAKAAEKREQRRQEKTAASHAASAMMTMMTSSVSASDAITRRTSLYAMSPGEQGADSGTEAPSTAGTVTTYSEDVVGRENASRRDASSQSANGSPQDCGVSSADAV
jgi:hypothetical protein